MASSRNTRTTGSLRSNTSGAVYVEFLVAFIPFFVMVLGMIQEALMYSAHLIVQHAAASAARSAMVVFPRLAMNRTAWLVRPSLKSPKMT